MVRLRIVVPLLAFAAALAAQQAARPKDVREAAKAGPNAIPTPYNSNPFGGTNAGGFGVVPQVKPVPTQRP